MNNSSCNNVNVTGQNPHYFDTPNTAPTRDEYKKQYPIPCPTCGRCPTCGKGGYYYPQYPTLPWGNPSIYYKPVGSTTTQI